MFGLGWMEIALLLAVLVLFFGARPSTRVLGKLFGTYQKVNGVKQQFTGLANPLSLLSKLGSGDPAKPPPDKKT